MGPSELLSVRLFKQHISEYLPEYLAVDDANVLQTLQRSLSSNLYDSAEFLKIQLKNNQVDFSQVIEEFVSELADHYVQSPEQSDPVIEQLLKNNYFSFASKVESAKELQLAMQRSERKRLKEILCANDEAQEAEDLRIVFERLERQELKKFLQETEGFSAAAGYAQMSRNYEHTNIAPPPLPPSFKKKNTMGHWLKIAAIFLVIVIPAGILLYRNMMNETVPAVAKVNNEDSSREDVNNSKSNKKQNSSSEKIKLNDSNRTSPDTKSNRSSTDLTNQLAMNLPEEQIYNGVITVEKEEQGWSKEDEKISIVLISKRSQVDYLNKKNIEFQTLLKTKELEYDKATTSGKGLGLRIQILRKEIFEIQNAIVRSNKMKSLLLKSNLSYDFDGSTLKIYSNIYSNTKHFSIELRTDYESNKKEYFLFIDGIEYQKVIKNM
jgi:hypothetical protein